MPAKRRRMPSSRPRETAIDDFVDGLTINPDNHDDYDGPDSSPSSDTSNDTRAQKELDRSAARALRWVLPVIALAVGLGCGGVIEKKSAHQADGFTEPQAVVTVTVTETKAAMPESCKRVMAGWEKLLHNAAAITSANGEQLDIFSEAYQAILSKDWKKLNELTERQRALEHKLSDDTFKLMPNLKELTEDIKTCRSDVDSTGT